MFEIRAFFEKLSHHKKHCKLVQTVYKCLLFKLPPKVNFKMPFFEELSILI